MTTSLYTAGGGLTPYSPDSVCAAGPRADRLHRNQASIRGGGVDHVPCQCHPTRRGLAKVPVPDGVEM